MNSAQKVYHIQKAGYVKYMLSSYSITSVGYRADPGFLVVNLQVTAIKLVVGCPSFP